MPYHGLVGGDRRWRLAEHGPHAERLHLVVLRRAGAMRVDVVDLVGREAGIGDRRPHGADDGAAIRVRAGAVEAVRPLAAARAPGRAPWRRAPAPLPGFPAPAPRRPRSSRSPPASSRRGGRRGRVVVAGREGREQGEADHRLRRHAALGADAERGLRLAALDRLDPELDRGGAGGAGGGQRDRRAPGAETVGQPLADAAEQEHLEQVLNRPAAAVIIAG